VIRDLRPEDLPRVLEINQAARPALGDLDAERLAALVDMSWAIGVEQEGLLVGFVLALQPGQPYSSANYQWLEERFDDHVYVDRIGVAASARGAGLGSRLYEELYRRAGNRRVTCEVNTRPPNEGSIRFHERHGFEGVGTQETEGGKKEVLLMARPAPWPVVIEVPVQWGDMDALGHVNNTVYFRWFESARIALFERIGMDASAPSAVGPILATTTCDFLQPLHYPDHIACGARVSRVGNSSFTMEYGVWRQAAPTDLVARGSGVVVTVDYKTERKVRVPQALRDGIEAL